MEVGDLVKLVVSLRVSSHQDVPKVGDIVIVKYISGSSILISDFSGNFYRRIGGYKTYFRKDDFRLLSEIRNEKIDEIKK